MGIGGFLLFRGNTTISFYSPISSDCRQASLTDIRLGVQRRISLLSNLGIGSCATSSAAALFFLLLLLSLLSITAEP